MGPVAAALPALGSFVTAAAPYAKAVGTIAGAAGAVKGLAQQPQAGQAAPAPPPVVIEPPPMLIPPPPEEEEEDVEISGGSKFAAGTMGLSKDAASAEQNRRRGLLGQF